MSYTGQKGTKMGMMALEKPIIMRGNRVEKFLTTAQIAKRFDVTSRTVARWIEEGLLKGATKINPDVKNSPFIVPQTSVEELEEIRASKPETNI